MSLFAELRRRNVFKVGAAYAIVSWLLLQVGEVLAPALQLPEWVNSALAFFIILGFPLALLFAWAFELTPDGIRREEDVLREESITATTGQKLNSVILALLVLAVGYFAIDKYLIHPRLTTEPGQDLLITQSASGHPIAVLPLADMSPEGDNEYFSDGLTEELLNLLARIQGLRVAGRTSSFAFKGRGADLREIGEQLGVRSILEGSVRKDAQRNRVRITLQLINAEDGYQLWSQTYDRELDDIFAIQEEVAHEVATALRVELLGEDEARLDQLATTGTRAYDLYLKGLQGINEASYRSLAAAVEYFGQVLEADPAYLPAKLGLVRAWDAQARTGAISNEEATGQGIPMLENVLAETPGDPQALNLMASMVWLRFELDEADRWFQKALEADPNSAATLKDYGRFLFDTGIDLDRGMALVEAAREIEPLDLQVLWDDCQTKALVQHFAESIEACGRIRELAPESPIGWYGWALAHMNQGDLARTIVGYRRAIERDPGDYEMLAAVGSFWRQLGDLERAEEWLARAEVTGAGEPVPTWNRMVHLYDMERPDLAADLARRSLESGMADRFGVHFFMRRTWASWNLTQGRYEDALRFHRQTLPWAFSTPLDLPDNMASWGGDVMTIVTVLRRAEPLSERPTQLMDALEASLDETSLPPYWGVWAESVTRAQIAIERGDRSLALEHLSRARDQHFVIGWRQVLLQDPTFLQMRGDPDFEELLAWYDSEAERQRVLAYELVEEEF